MGNSTKTSKNVVSTSAKSNFGRKGWTLITLCGLMLYFSTGTSVDGLNATVQGLAEIHGWDTAVLLSFSTISGLVSIAGMLVFGVICNRIGARWVAVLSLVLGGLSYIWYGKVTSVTQYAIALCLVSLFSNVYAWIAGGAYLPYGFLKRKGLPWDGLPWVIISHQLPLFLLLPNWRRHLAAFKCQLQSLGLWQLCGRGLPLIIRSRLEPLLILFQ